MNIGQKIAKLSTINYQGVKYIKTRIKILSRTWRPIFVPEFFYRNASLMIYGPLSGIQIIGLIGLAVRPSVLFFPALETVRMGL